LSPLPRTVRRMYFDGYLRTHGDPDGQTPIEPYRSATVRSELYDGQTVGLPVVVVARAPAPPAPAEWVCVRQTLGHDRHWLAWVPADRVRARYGISPPCGSLLPRERPTARRLGTPDGLRGLA